MKRKKAIIFGISGQDGAYLSNFLLKKYTLTVALKLKLRLNLLC